MVVLMVLFHVDTDLEKTAEAVIMMPTRLHSAQMQVMRTHTPILLVIAQHALLTGLGRRTTDDLMKCLDTAHCSWFTFSSQ